MEFYAGEGFDRLGETVSGDTGEFNMCWKFQHNYTLHRWRFGINAWSFKFQGDEMKRGFSYKHARRGVPFSTHIFHNDAMLLTRGKR